jgi:hypothetical protein
MGRLCRSLTRLSNVSEEVFRPRAVRGYRYRAELLTQINAGRGTPFKIENKIPPDRVERPIQSL